MAVVEQTGQYGAGGTGTTAPLYADRRLFGDPNEISELTGDVAPFTMWMNAFARDSEKDSVFKWFEHRDAWRDNRVAFFESTIAFTASDSGTAFTNLSIETTAGSNDAVTWIRAGDVIRVQDAGDNALEGNLLVTNVDSTTSIDVKVLASDPGFDVADGDKFLKIGSAFEEGSGKTSAIADEVETLWGSTQIFKELVSYTGTLEELELRGGVNEIDRLRNVAARRLAADVERSMLFGERIGGAAGVTVYSGARLATLDGTHELNTSIGMLQAVKAGNAARILDKTYAAYTYENWIDDSERIFEYGSDSKIAYCGRSAYSFLSSKVPIRNGLLSLSSGDSSFGVKVSTIESPSGDLQLMKHPMMYDNYDDFAIIVDPSNVNLVVFRDLNLEEGVQANGTDGKEDQWMFDVGLKPKLIETHSLMRFSS